MFKSYKRYINSVKRCTLLCNISIRTIRKIPSEKEKAKFSLQIAIQEMRNRRVVVIHLRLCKIIFYFLPGVVHPERLKHYFQLVRQFIFGNIWNGLHIMYSAWKNYHLVSIKRIFLHRGREILLLPGGA